MIHLMWQSWDLNLCGLALNLLLTTNVCYHCDIISLCSGPMALELGLSRASQLAGCLQVF